MPTNNPVVLFPGAPQEPQDRGELHEAAGGRTDPSGVPITRSVVHETLIKEMMISIKRVILLNISKRSC